MIYSGPLWFLYKQFLVRLVMMGRAGRDCAWDEPEAPRKVLGHGEKACAGKQNFPCLL